MGKRKSLGELLGERMLEYARKHNIPIIKPKELTQEEAKRIQRVHEDVSEFLKNLHEFERESRKINIRVKASNYNPSNASCNYSNSHLQADLCYQK